MTDRLRGSRIGVLRDLFRPGAPFEPAKTVIEAQLEKLIEQGATLVDPVTTGLDLLGMMPTLRVNYFELQTAFNAYLRRRGPSSPVRTFKELMATGKYLPLLKSRFQETLVAGDLGRNTAYLARLANQRRIHEALVTVMDRHQVQALVYPVKLLGAPSLGEADDGAHDNNISSISGLPAVVVPAGMTDAGLPLSMEFLARPFDEATLLALAHAYEDASRARKPPPTTPGLPDEVFSY